MLTWTRNETAVTAKGRPCGRGGELWRSVGAAEAILEENWRGTFTVPSSVQYPHQWSWDSAFVAIGNRHARAAWCPSSTHTLPVVA